MKITFLDSGREPQCPPNPAYPNGIDVDLTFGAERWCAATLPYPAPRCGAMVIECERCGLRNAVTVAGRPDDPRTVKMACKLLKETLQCGASHLETEAGGSDDAGNAGADSA